MSITSARPIPSIQLEGRLAVGQGKRIIDNPYRFQDQLSLSLWSTGYNEAVAQLHKAKPE
jgi:hypothetical protein